MFPSPSLPKLHRAYFLRRFLLAQAWAILWLGLSWWTIEFFYGPGEAFANDHPFLLGGLTAVFLVAVPVSLGFFLARLISLLSWKGRLRKSVLRYLPAGEDRDPLEILNADRLRQLYDVSEILMGRDWVVFPGAAMRRDSIVGIFYRDLSRISTAKRIRITLVDDTGRDISYEGPLKQGADDHFLLMTMHTWATYGDERQLIAFRQKEGEDPDYRKLRIPIKPTSLGLSRWDRSPILEDNTVASEYERWLLAAYAPYIATEIDGDFDFAGGWERTLIQEKRSKDMLADSWDIHSKEELLDTVEHLVVTGRMGHDGWQLGRAPMVLGSGYIAGYLTRKELLEYSLPAAKAIQETFRSWEELHDSYMASYDQWSQHRRSQWLRHRAYEALKRDPASPLNTVPFQLELSGRYQEAVRML